MKTVQAYLDNHGGLHVSAKLARDQSIYNIVTKHRYKGCVGVYVANSPVYAFDVALHWDEILKEVQEYERNNC